MEQERTLEKLPLEDELFFVLRDQLFGGCWDRMVADMRERQLWCHPSDEVDRIVEADLSRIARLRELEIQAGFDLQAMRSLT